MSFKKENIFKNAAKYFDLLDKIETYAVLPKDLTTAQKICKLFCVNTLKNIKEFELMEIRVHYSDSRTNKIFVLETPQRGESKKVMNITNNKGLEDYTKAYGVGSISIKDVSISLDDFEKWLWKDSGENEETLMQVVGTILSHLIKHGTVYFLPHPKCRNYFDSSESMSLKSFSQLVIRRDLTYVLCKNSKGNYDINTLKDVVKKGLYVLAWNDIHYGEDSYLHDAVRSADISFESNCVNKEEFVDEPFKRYVYKRFTKEDEHGQRVIINGTKFSKCLECGKPYFPPREAAIIKGHARRPINIPDNMQCCSDCFKKRYFICESCGRMRPKITEYKTDTMETHCCMDCWVTRPIHRYYYNPKLINISPTKIYYGIELEVEGKKEIERMASDLVSKYKKIYIKRDSSIMNGFEIVTVPLESFYDPWISSMLNDLRRNGFRSFQTRTCGIHVHVSSEPLKQRDIQWLTEFFYNKNNSGFLKLISERDIRLLLRWANLDKGGVGLLEKSDVIARRKKIEGRVRHERHSILNLTKEHTVEFRMFRGTLRHESFLGNLEFVKCLLESSDYIAPYYPEVINFVRNNRGHFNYLASKLQRLKIVNSSFHLAKEIPPVKQLMEEPTGRAGYTPVRVTEEQSNPYIDELRHPSTMISADEVRRWRNEARNLYPSIGHGYTASNSTIIFDDPENDQNDGTF